MNISRKTTAQLHSILAKGGNDDIIDEVYDELDRRERDEELRDHTESDRLAAFSERFELFYNEY